MNMQLEPHHHESHCVFEPQTNVCSRKLINISSVTYPYLVTQTTG